MGINIFMVVPRRQGAILSGKPLSAGVVFSAAAIAVAAPITKRLYSTGKSFVVRCNCTAFPESYMMSGIKRKTGDMSEGADFPAFIGGAQRITTVFYQIEILFANN